MALPDGRTTIYGVVSCGQCLGAGEILDSMTIIAVLHAARRREVPGAPG